MVTPTLVGIHHPTKSKFVAYRSYGRGDKTFLISHVELSDQMIKDHITIAMPSLILLGVMEVDI